MAVSTVSSLSEAFTAGVPTQTEDGVHGTENGKAKSGSPLPPIAEEDVSMKDDGKPVPEKNGKDAKDAKGTEDGKVADGDEEEGDEDEDEDEDDAILQVHD